MKQFRLALPLATILHIALSARAYEVYKVSDALNRVIKLKMPTAGYPIERTVDRSNEEDFRPNRHCRRSAGGTNTSQRVISRSCVAR